jgi:hypothetical protein
VRWTSAAQEPLPPPRAGADEIRRAADEILARREFQEPPRSLYQRAIDWVGDRIGDVLGALVDGGVASVVAWIVLLAAVAVLGYLVVRAVQSDRRRRRPDAAGSALDVEVDERRPPAAWDAEAARLETEGNWRGALRCRYRSLIASLARDGVIDEVPGRTAGEYRLVVGQARPAVADPFAGATDLFERAWYGNEDTGPEAASSFRRLADRVVGGAAA